jgi:hypothetical protein
MFRPVHDHRCSWGSDWILKKSLTLGCYALLGSGHAGLGAHDGRNPHAVEPLRSCFQEAGSGQGTRRRARGPHRNGDRRESGTRHERGSGTDRGAPRFRRGDPGQRGLSHAARSAVSRNSGTGHTLCMASVATLTWVYGDGRAHPGTWNWRQHRGVLHCEWRAAKSAAVS